MTRRRRPLHKGASHRSATAKQSIRAEGTASIVVTEVPTAMGELVDRVRRELRRRIPLACEHLRSGGFAFVCGMHPAGGIRCVDCAIEHTHRHSYELEHACDECGAIVDTIHGGYAVLFARQFPVRTTRGDPHTLTGSLTVSGMGSCPDCFQRVAA